MLIAYLKSLVKVLAIGAAFASIPLFASLVHLQPPWPPAIGFVSAALVLLGALIVWEFTRNSKVKDRRKWIVRAAVFTLAGLLIYLTLYSLFIETVPGSSERAIRGFECTPDALLVHKGACPDLSREALRDAEWNSETLWTRKSLTVVRLGLAVSWILFTAGLIMAVGAVIAGRKIERSPAMP